MLTNSLIYLFAATISVPIAKRFGFGSVLGYLLAGIIIGPHLLHLIGDQTDVMHFAEFGVVMMLFLIGLELQPSRLWSLRKSIIGLGGLQVLLTTVLIFSVLSAITSFTWQALLAISLILSLSSTAIVMQSLGERGLTKSAAGSNSFSVLLFQDIALIPILALIPLLAIGNHLPVENHDTHNLIDGLPTWAQIVVTLGSIASIIVAGRFLSTPIFRYIAETRLREIFTAFALLIVLAIAALMQAIGLSPALGSFVAGVVLAESEYRHELEVNIEPFKGLLLGLFFITVGASVDFSLLASKPILVLGSVVVLILLKASVLFGLATIFGWVKSQGILFAIALAQGGEFAFVLIGAAKQFAVFDNQIGNLLTVIVALSMLMTPVLLMVYQYIYGRSNQAETQQADEIHHASSDVILAGYGRFGQIIGRLLTAQSINTTILDDSPSQVEMVRRFGNLVYYGDASRMELLEAAGAEHAKILVIAVDDPVKTLEIIETAKRHFPHLKILARAVDRRHTYELIKAEIEEFRRETFDSALHLGVSTLKHLGINENAAHRAGKLFEQHDVETLHLLAQKWGDDKSYGIALRQRVEDLKRVLEADQQNP